LEGLGGAPSLGSLFLGQTFNWATPGREGFIEMVMEKIGSSSVHTLNLSQNRINGDSSQIILDMLDKCPALRVIDLSMNDNNISRCLGRINFILQRRQEEDKAKARNEAEAKK
jgi:hypothetical protein